MALHPPGLLKKLKLHHDWLESLGRSGRQLALEDDDCTGLDFSGRILSQASLPGVRFDKASLKQVDLYSSNLASASFSGADLTEADLTRATLDYASLNDASLRNAKAFKASFIEVDMRGADLTDANLTDAYFVGADLERAILRGANITGATLEGVRLFRADLTSVKGFERVSAKWIDIGPEESPIRLEGDQLRDWLVCAVRGKAH
ncbi:pentapeptide repeat-containing protein [Hymenobacter sp. BT664]|uniref:Pentapeptide repeat-containing protein n=1 Tax=Hymenobacter montanus TaxID=2771359 RepID=A0A927GIZ3_9BACT|nr:pentapeptide repeat-containing protein [Hymenobacter montanus]MBD2767937.1 pentapeptide repeat-containing protein [Hymenobacter montanus]